MIVGNPGEHELQNVEAVLDISGAPNLEFAQDGGEQYHEETSGMVSIGGSTSIIQRRKPGNSLWGTSSWAVPPKG